MVGGRTFDSCLGSLTADVCNMLTAVPIRRGVLRRRADAVPFSPPAITIVRERPDPVGDLVEVQQVFRANGRDPLNRRGRRL